MFTGRDRVAQRQWWEQFGTDITSQLVLGLCYETMGTRVEQNAALSAVASVSHAAAYADIYGADAASAAASAAFAASASSAYAASADASTAISYAVRADFSVWAAGFSEFMVGEIERDLEKAHAGSELLVLTPLWSASVPREFFEAWRFAPEEAMRRDFLAERLSSWLMGCLEGKPPLDDMQNWFNEWWLNHPKNTDRSPAFKDLAETSPSSKQPEAIAKPASPPATQPPAIIEKIYKEPTYSVALASDGVAQTLTDTAEKCKEALRAFLACDDTQAPITVSVEAPWGAGKTSFLHCLRGSLEKQNLIPTVWFNPWKHEAGKTLWAAFAVAYERQMAEKLSWPGRWRRRAMLSWQRLSGAERLLLGMRLVLWLLGLGSLAWLFTHGVATETKNGSATDMKMLLTQHLPVLGLPLLIWGMVKDVVSSFGSPLKVDMVSVFTRDHHEESVDDLHRFHEDFARLMRAYTPGTGPVERFMAEVRSQTDPHWPAQWRFVCRALLLTVCRWLRKLSYTFLLDAPEQLHAPQKPRWSMNRVAVFIDDLDRCEAPKAAEVLQSLHLMLSVAGHERRANEPAPPGVICILGMDREKVAAAVAAKHEKLLPLLLAPDENGKVSQKKALGFGHEFLEKFVQITLHLPGLVGSDQDQYLRMITGWKGDVSGKVAPPSAGGATSVSTLGSSGTSVPPLPQPDSPPKSSAPSSDEAAQRAREAARVQADVQQVETHLNDGQMAFLCACYVADALEHNPRRLKQFVNLFRLRLYLAAAMKLLDIPTLDPEQKERVNTGKLSAHDLAKLVALDLSCPQTMTKMRERSSVTHDTLTKEISDEHQGSRAVSILKMMEHTPSADKQANAVHDLSKAPLDKYFQHLASVALPAESPPPFK